MTGILIRREEIQRQTHGGGGHVKSHTHTEGRQPHAGRSEDGSYIAVSQGSARIAGLQQKVEVRERPESPSEPSRNNQPANIFILKSRMVRK